MKGLQGELYHYAKLALRVDSYFQVLTLLNSFQKKRYNLL
jgi:hypothetical protein